MEGFFYDAFENTTKDKTLEITVAHKSFENVELLKPYNGDSYTLTIKPGESAVVVKKQINLLEETSLSLSLRKKIT